MKKKNFLSTAVAVVLLLTAASSLAGTVVLRPGMSYTVGETTVQCVAPPVSEPVVLVNCQYWDDFQGKCLYEEKKYVLGDVSCLERCQHWDGYNRKCLYAESCRMTPARDAFVKTTCARFDSYENRCLERRQELIRAVTTQP